MVAFQSGVVALLSILSLVSSFIGSTDRRMMQHHSCRTTIHRHSRTRLWSSKQTKWEQRFEQLQQFYNYHGHTDVTPSYEEATVGLQNFVQYQRKQYRKWLAGEPSTLDDSKIEKLTRLEFIFDKHLFTWENRYKELEQYKEEFGHVNVPTKYGTLGQWVTKQRKSRRDGALAPHLIDKLDDVNFVWDVKQWMFEQGLEGVREFKEKNGHLNIKVTDEVGSWFYSRRKEYLASESKAGSYTLSEEHREALTDAGFGPDLATRRRAKISTKASWEERFEELKEFKSHHNHTTVPRKPRYAQLSTWINYQRNLKVAGKLRPSRLVALESIGFIWNTNDYRWQRRFSDLREFQTLNGHCNVLRGAGDLGSWVDQQRVEKSNYDKGKKSHLTAKRVALLNSIGFDYTRGETRRIEHDLSWSRSFGELRKWKAKYGDCNVPRGVDPVLGLWVAQQRRSLKASLRLEKTTLSDTRIKQLTDIGLLDPVDRSKR